MCHPKRPGRRALRIARRRQDAREMTELGSGAWALIQWDNRIARLARRLAARHGDDPEHPALIAEATRALIAQGRRFPPEVAAWRARRGIPIPEAARPVATGPPFHGHP